MGGGAVVGIVGEDVDRVRASSDLVAIASERMALRRSGRRWVGLCPFHAEKTPSFSINGEEGLYYCFGCQAKGDVITFVREAQQLDFVGAVEWLASRVGIQLRYDTSREGGERRRRSALVEAMERAVDWYHERLLSSPDASRARGYLRSRGYDGEVVRRFRLGWAPDEWDALVRDLRLPEDVLRDTGLGFVNRRRRQQDTFRARVLFPIFDVRGDAVAFGGRALPDTDGPKYKNSPATAIYDKGEVLYGLNWSKTEIVSSGEAVVCEGYTDVIGIAQAGLARAVATCGTALTERHVAALRPFASRIVLAFDADAAGQGAAERFYEWERRYEVDVHVAALPEGADPADLARSDPEALRRAVEQARPFLAFRVGRVLASADLRSPESRAHAAERALELVREHPNEIVRHEYAGQVAAHLDLPVEVIVRRADRRTGGLPLVVAAPRHTRASPEIEALRVAVHRPEEVADLLREALFRDDINVAAFRALVGAGTLREAIDAAEPEAADLLQRLAVEDDAGVPGVEIVGRLAEEAVRREVRRLEVSAMETTDIADDARTMEWLKLRTEELRDPRAQPSATAQLVAWLADRAEEG